MYSIISREQHGATRTAHQTPWASGGLLEPEPWTQDALCAQTDPEAFFPDRGGSTQAAKTICKRCDVTEECLAYALRNNERFGIWGGKSERERRKMGKVQ